MSFLLYKQGWPWTCSHPPASACRSALPHLDTVCYNSKWNNIDFFIVSPKTDTLMIFNIDFVSWDFISCCACVMYVYEWVYLRAYVGEHKGPLDTSTHTIMSTTGKHVSFLLSNLDTISVSYLMALAGISVLYWAETHRALFSSLESVFPLEYKVGSRLFMLSFPVRSWFPSLGNLLSVFIITIGMVPAPPPDIICSH